MIARDDEGTDAVGRHAVEVLHHPLMAGTLAVIGEISSQQHQPRTKVDDAVGDSTHDGIALGHHLAVAGISGINGAARGHQRGSQQMSVTDDDDAVGDGTGRRLDSKQCG